MVLVRFDKKKMLELTGTNEGDVLEIPWLLGGEARVEDGTLVMEFNPDRPDLYSVQGIARAIRAFRKVEGFGYSKINELEEEVEVDPPKYRPFFSLGVVKGCRVRGFIGEIIDFQEKLHKTLGRDRKLAAIGLHDLSKVKFPVSYRAVPRNRKFIPLGEQEPVVIDEFMKNNRKAIEYGSLVGDELPAIMDGNDEIISLPPILNSSITTVTEGTVDLLVDVTGTNESVVNKTMILMLTSLSYPQGSIGTFSIAGRRLPVINYERRKIRKELIRKMIGYSLPEEAIVESLKKMGYGIEDDVAVIPPYRVDIFGDVDVIEDILKGIGYDKIARKREGFVSFGSPNGLRAIENKLRTLLVGYGLNETVSTVLVNKRFNSIYGFKDKSADIVNPASQEQDSVRSRISPSLMETFRNNFRNTYPQRIFEIGSVYLDGKERDVLGIGIAHKEASFTEIKGIFVGVLEDLGMERYEIVRDQEDLFVQGRVGGIVTDSTKIGFFGEVHPRILKDLGMKVPIALGELEISGVLH